MWKNHGLSTKENSMWLREKADGKEQEKKQMIKNKKRQKKEKLEEKLLVI
jgi:hypothetical protein